MIIIKNIFYLDVVELEAIKAVFSRDGKKLLIVNGCPDYKITIMDL